MLKPLTSLALMCFATSTMADVTIVMQDSSGDRGQYNSSSTVRVKDGIVVMSEDDEESGAIMYNQSDKSIVQVDHESRSYVIIDEEMANKMSAAINQQMAMVNEKLKNLPPEQREMIMDRMPDMMGGDAKAEITVARTGKTETINGFDCEVVTVLTDGQRSSGACIASANALGISKSDYGTIENMMKMMGEFADQIGTREMPDLAAVGGFPVKFNNASDDEKSISTLQSVSTDDLSDKYFTIPEGYSERSLGR